MSKEAKEFMAQNAYNPVFGARPVKRYMQKFIETEIGKKIISGEVGEGKNIYIDVSDGVLVIRVD